MNAERRRLQQLVRLARQLVALRRLLADRQQPDARRLDAEGDARVHGCPSPRTAAGAAAGTRRWRRRRAAPPAAARVGIVAASAGRSTPGSMPNAPCAAITVAPVCPALNSAAASPRATASAATLIDAPRLAPQRRRRRLVHRHDVGRVDDADAASSRRPAWRRSSASSTSAGPTSATPRSKCRAAASAPSTTCRGAKSPPIASTAIHIMTGGEQVQGSGFWVRELVDGSTVPEPTPNRNLNLSTLP